MYQEFYPNGEKVLPKNFEQTISPLSLMVWFLDDGTNQKNQVSSELTVQGFLPIEIGRILSTLRIKFGLECNTVVRYDRRYQKRETNIRFSKEGTLRLFEIIRPLVEVECMRYKVYPCNDYVPNPH